MGGCPRSWVQTGLHHLSSRNAAEASCITRIRFYFIFFLFILLTLIPLASEGVGPATWVNVLTSARLRFLFGPILAFGSVSSPKPLQAPSRCAVSYCWWQESKWSCLSGDCCERSVSTSGLERQGRSNFASSLMRRCCRVLAKPESSTGRVAPSALHRCRLLL